jgi:hypothetical protein
MGEDHLTFAVGKNELVLCPVDFAGEDISRISTGDSGRKQRHHR